MTHPLIIGIAGPARHGKDTIARRLVEQHGFVQLSYAGAIRDMLEIGLGVSTHYLYDDKETDIPWLGCSARHLMQTLGTQWGRHCIREDLWRLILQRRITDLADATDRLVISDVRFANEADWIRDLPNGHVWHVFRPGQATLATAHPSEAGIHAHPRDCLLSNTTLDALYSQIDRAVQHLIPNS